MKSIGDSAGSVRIYSANALAFDDARLAHFAGLLDEQETARAERFVFDKHRRRFIAAHGFLREVLARETKREARALSYEFGPNGKPRVIGSALHFNLTHTGEHVVLAVGESELGLDAEEIRASRVDGPLAERVMTAEEFETWSQATRDDRVNAFFRLWSAKECVMKATGRGMQLEPRSFAVFAPGSLDLYERVASDGRDWTLHALQCPPEYSLAVATQGAVRLEHQT